MTIEATGKKWKAIQLIGLASILVGMLGCMLVDNTIPQSQRIETPSIILFVAGVFILSFGRIGAWWHHG